jgi:ornithine carbamoyltransferase
MLAKAHLRPTRTALGQLSRLQQRTFADSASPRHFLSISDLSAPEFSRLVDNASGFRSTFKKDGLSTPLSSALTGKTVAMIFSKRSTRTRISTEGAVAALGGHPMFLGSNDIQLGVNESREDTARVISSMTSCIVARVGDHSEVADLAKFSSVPVINALCNDFHPLQAIADFATIQQAFPDRFTKIAGGELSNYGGDVKIAWIGDANNVLFDMATAAVKLGINISVATPKGYSIPPRMLNLIRSASKGVEKPGILTETNVPEEAIKDADVLVTDTWISMGQEEESARRLKAFKGFQITNELAKRGGAKEGWKFMHCLPRHRDEVADEVFKGPRSLVYPEAENRLYAAISALEAFVVNKGVILGK